MAEPAILLVDDEDKLRSLLARILELEGYTVFQAENVHKALTLFNREEIGLVITDVKMPDGNGLELLSQIKSRSPFTEVIVITAYGTIADGVKAIKEGAFDYITKGDGDEQIIPIVSRAMDKVRMQQRILHLEKMLDSKLGFEHIIGHSPLIRQAIELGKKVAPTDATVLLLGETGTGKEVFAQAIHQSSARKSKSFVAVNCSAISKDLLESEMFGHKAGAFTGAVKDKRGLVEEADKGTLFLDEIGELNLDLQAKLLRFLETGIFYKVGDSKPTKVDVRIITATNRDLLKEIDQELFRSDLYYRLSVFAIQLPPLRDRKEDIKALAEHFLQMYAAKIKNPVLRMHPQFVEGLRQLTYKGNIRELKNIMERAVILADGEELGPAQLPLECYTASPQGVVSEYSLAEMERKHIIKTLQASQGNKTRTAEQLGIGLTTLYRKLHEYGIE